VLSVIVLISATWSLNPVNTIKAWIMMGGYVLFGYVYFLQGDCDRRRRERWLLVTALTGAAWGLFGIVRVLLTEASGKALTIASTYSYGAFPSLLREHGTIAPTWGCSYPRRFSIRWSERPGIRIVYGLSALLIGCGVILAFARAGWLAVMLVVPLAVLAWARRHREGRRLMLPAFAVLLMISFAVASGISRRWLATRKRRCPSRTFPISNDSIAGPLRCHGPVTTPSPESGSGATWMRIAPTVGSPW